MLRLNVLPLLKANGLSKYYLNKQLGMSYTNFSSMIHNKTKSIQYKHLEIICRTLNCTPNDLLVISDDEPEE